MYTLEDLRRHHPKWDLNNLLDITAANDNDAVKLVVLFEVPCTKCHQEMGEHRWSWSSGLWHCPEPTVVERHSHSQHVDG